MGRETVLIFLLILRRVSLVLIRSYNGPSSWLDTRDPVLWEIASRVGASAKSWPWLRQSSGRS
eukprot:1444632-Pleurochrysis_carterae.AAC.1